MFLSLSFTTCKIGTRTPALSVAVSVTTQIHHLAQFHRETLAGGHGPLAIQLSRSVTGGVWHLGTPPSSSKIRGSDITAQVLPTPRFPLQSQNAFGKLFRFTLREYHSV